MSSWPIRRIRTLWHGSLSTQRSPGLSPPEGPWFRELDSDQPRLAEVHVDRRVGLISYMALEVGTPVLSSSGTEFGKVEHVLQVPELTSLMVLP